MSERSASVSIPNYNPSSQQQDVAITRKFLEQARADAQNKIVGGGPVAGAPTTASTQITGAGATNWRVDLAAFLVIVDGVAKEFAVEADRVIHDTTQLVANGQSCTAAIVAKNVSGTITLVNVKGAAATTGSQLAPTDAEIDAAVSDVPWVKVCECTINRTADTTVTQSQDNAKRPLLGVNVDADFGTFA